jgi:hypothetical protein
MVDNEQLSDVQDQSLPVETVAPEEANEKLLRQSEVDKLIGREKKKAYERGKMDGLAQLQPAQAEAAQSAPVAQAPVPQQAPTYAPQQQNSMGGMQQFNPDQIQQMIDERLAKQQQEYQQRLNDDHNNRIANEFVTKLQAGKAKYPDFDKKVEPLLNSIGNIPEIAYLSNAVDNTADVIYELAENPTKIANILSLAQRTPHLAHAEMIKLSNSIKSNESASQTPSVNEPLSQLKPSTVGGDNGSLSVKDFKKMPWLKG